MKKIFINVFQELDTGYSRWINMGYLKASLNQIPNCEVYINFYKLDEIGNAILDVEKEKPEIIGLTVLQFNYYATIKFSELVKKKLPYIHITMGNTFASTYAEYILRNFNFIDSIVVGEGEFSLLELCSRVLEKKDLKNCKGIYYRDNSIICYNGDRNLHDNLDDYLFPDRDFYKYKANIYGVLGSRGCYGNCTFCDINTLFKEKVRVRSISNILDEIELLVKENNAKYITFYDSTFCVNKKEAYGRLEELYKGIVKRNIEFNFSINLRSEQMDEKLMDIILKLKKVGLDYLMFGFEAGNNEDLSFYGKPANVENHLNTLRLLRENKIITDNYDISISYGFINFHPYSKLDNIRKNLQFLKESDLFVNFEIVNTRFLNFGNGKISKKIEKDGLLISNINEPIVNPLGYNFVNPKVQMLYEIGKADEKLFLQLNIPDPDEWISVYRRWKKFFKNDLADYDSIFKLYIKDKKELSNFIIDIMINALDEIEQNNSKQSILDKHEKLIKNTIIKYSNDCKIFNSAYQKFNIDLFKIGEVLVR